MHQPATVSLDVMEGHRQGLWVKTPMGPKNQGMFGGDEATQPVLGPNGDIVGAGIPDGGMGSSPDVGMHLSIAVSLSFPSSPLAGLWGSPTLTAGHFAGCGQDAVMHKKEEDKLLP